MPLGTASSSRTSPRGTHPMSLVRACTWTLPSSGRPACPTGPLPEAEGRGGVGFWAGVVRARRWSAVTESGSVSRSRRAKLSRRWQDVCTCVQSPGLYSHTLVKDGARPITHLRTGQGSKSRLRVPGKPHSDSHPEHFLHTRQSPGHSQT